MIRKYIIALCLLGPPIFASPVTIVESTFDTNADGWKVRPSPMVGPNQLPIWLNNVKGHQGAIVSLELGVQYPGVFVAPDKFLGDKSTAYGGHLTFDTGTEFIHNPALPNERGHLVYISDGSTWLVYDPPASLSANQWATLDVPLYLDSNWKVVESFGASNNEVTIGREATEAELRAVLGDLEYLYIRGEWHFLGIDSVWLDNVRIIAPESPASAVPEPATALLLGAGLVGVFAIRKRIRVN